MSNHKWIISFMVLALVLGTAAMLLMMTIYQGRPQPPAVELLALEYIAADHCPGDVLPYQIKWQINRTAILIVTSSHMRGFGAEGDTAIPGRMPSAALITNPTPRILHDEDLSFTIPDLPAGDYARVLAVGTISEDSEPAIVIMPYTIRADCE